VRHVHGALVGLVIATTALAGEQRIEDAIEQFNRAEFARARDLLVDLADSPEFSDAQRLTARMYLAASYHALGDLASAKAQLKLLARQQPKAKVDPDTFLPEVIALWEQARREVAHELLTDPPMPPAPVVRQPRGPPTPAGPLGYAFIPFGVGQFTNGQPGKGTFFLVGEALTLGTFAVSLTLLESLKQPSADRVFLQSGSFLPGDVAKAQTLNLIQFVTFWAGAALAAGGVIDAVISRPPSKRQGGRIVATPGGVAIRFD
jgi:hypothetical protein